MIPEDDPIALLCRELGLDLDCYSFQFLWLMPIIEVMWADGRCQKEEVETLLHYVDRFVALVNPDVPEITTERARRFFLPLLEYSAAVDRSQRKRLARLVDQIIHDVVEPARHDKRLYLFQICREVAHIGVKSAADRLISAEEERLLMELFKALRLGEKAR